MQNRKCTITGTSVIEWDLTDKLPLRTKKQNKTIRNRITDALNSLRELYKNKKNSTVEDWKDQFPEAALSARA